jgi:ABC-type uncharacterized transport system involved in gliding motility auxiliary subunit
MGKIIPAHRQLSRTELEKENKNLARELRAALRKVRNLEGIIQGQGNSYADLGDLRRRNQKLELEKETLIEDLGMISQNYEKLADENMNLGTKNLQLVRACQKTMEIASQSLPLLSKAQPLVPLPLSPLQLNPPKF